MRLIGLAVALVLRILSLMGKEITRQELLELVRLDP
jgi:hypothetical protein